MAGSLLSFLPAQAGQSSETVPVLNSDKATTWTITNYVNNNSNKNQFTPYKPHVYMMFFSLLLLNTSVSNYNVSNCCISLQEVTIVIKTPTTVTSCN